MNEIGWLGVTSRVLPLMLTYIVSFVVWIYIYIYRERERYICVCVLCNLFLYNIHRIYTYIYIYMYIYIFLICYSPPEYKHAIQNVKTAIWLFVSEPHDKDIRSVSRTDLSRRQQLSSWTCRTWFEILFTCLLILTKFCRRRNKTKCSDTKQ